MKFYINIDELKSYLEIEYPDDSEYFGLGISERAMLDEKRYFINDLRDFIESNKEIAVVEGDN